jgi:hypothetical protein
MISKRISLFLAIVQGVSGDSFTLPLHKKTIPSASYHVRPGHPGTGNSFEFSYEVKLFFLHLLTLAKRF